MFAKDDSHAEDIVHTEDLIASFRNSYNPRIAVTVDMISTGTDIRPLECLLFMRDVKSRVLFEQMKGRGTRTISHTDFQAITKDASAKTHFMIVDAVGVCENDKTDSRPLERKKSVSFDNPKLRNLLSDIKKRNEQDIDITSKDTVIFAGYDEKAKEKARTIVDTFKRFIEENKDEITALQIIYSKPYTKRHLTYDEIREVADAIRKPPYQLFGNGLNNILEELNEVLAV